MNDIDTLWNTTVAQVKADLPDRPETDPAIPDGEYEAEVLDFSCFLSKKGAWIMKWVMAVRGGLLDGRLLVRFVPVTPRTSPYLKADVAACLGREAEFSGELADVARGTTGPAGREMHGVILRAGKKSRRGDDGETYLDVYINSVLSRPARPGAYSQPGPSASWAPEGAVQAATAPPTLPDAPSADASRFDAPFPDDAEAPGGDDDVIPF